MNYFDDIDFIHVAEKSTARNSGNDFTVSDGRWGIGMLLGTGYVRKKIHGSPSPILLKMPFLYLVHPGDYSNWYSVDGAVRDNRWFIARGARAERMVRAMDVFLKNGSPAIYLDNFQELIRIHKRLMHLFQCNVPARQYLLGVCAEEFIGAIYHQISARNRKSPVFQFIAEVVEEISLNPGLRRDFRRMAAESHVSYDYFRSCFQKYTGLSMRDFILQKRLEQAVELLNNSNQSIKEITYLCGFPRQAEFARFIKKKTGLTPSLLRRQAMWNNF